MHAKFGRNPSNGVELIEKNLKNIWEKFGLPPTAHFPPTHPQTGEPILTKKLAAHLQYTLRLPTKFDRIRFSRFGQTRGERNLFYSPIWEIWKKTIICKFFQIGEFKFRFTCSEHVSPRDTCACQI